MTFKEWILLEDLRVARFDPPRKICILDHQQPVCVNGVHIIDMKFEDWNLEWMLKTQHGQNGPVEARPAETIPPKGTSYSARLADGDWLNVNANFFEGGSTTIDTRPKYPSIRADWGNYAEFIGANGEVLKHGLYNRDDRERLLAAI